MSYFDTDWAAMTGNDWFYTIFSVIILILMTIAYAYALNPKNKAHLESQKNALFEDDQTNFGENNDR